MLTVEDYGEEFLVFGPEDQPNVFAAPEPEYHELRSGNLDPRKLKSWRYLGFTLKLLQDRYGIFTAGDQTIDCLVPKFQP
jgi:hypothetical protein